MMRGAAAVTITGLIVGGAIVTGLPHHKRPVSSATPVPSPTRASRSETREPLPPVKLLVQRPKARHEPTKRGARPRAAGGHLRLVWDALADCEASGDWTADTGNGFYGGLQFTLSTWHEYGGHGLPSQASRAEQIRVAERVRAGQGWGAWPVCSQRLGLR